MKCIDVCWSASNLLCYFLYGCVSIYEHHLNVSFTDLHNNGGCASSFGGKFVDFVPQLIDFHRIFHSITSRHFHFEITKKRIPLDFSAFPFQRY